MSSIRIRPYRLNDASLVWEALTELQPWMPWSHPDYSIEETRSWLAAQVQAFQQRTAFEFAITSAAGGYLC